MNPAEPNRPANFKGCLLLLLIFAASILVPYLLAVALM